MQRSKVRDFLFHGFLVTDVEEFVEQAKLRNTESNCTYLDQYDECECRIVTEIDNIEEGEEDRKARDDSRQNRFLFLFLFYSVTHNSKRNQGCSRVARHCQVHPPLSRHLPEHSLPAYAASVPLAYSSLSAHFVSLRAHRFDLAKNKCVLAAKVCRILSSRVRFAVGNHRKDIGGGARKKGEERIAGFRIRSRFRPNNQN